MKDEIVDIQPVTGTTGSAFKDLFKGKDDKVQMCIRNCMDAHQACLHLIQLSLHKGGAFADPIHIKGLADCAQICLTHADFMIRESNNHLLLASACAQICTKFVEECEKLTTTEEFLKQGVEACRRCAASCQDMLSETQH